MLLCSQLTAGHSILLLQFAEFRRLAPWRDADTSTGEPKAKVEWASEAARGTERDWDIEVTCLGSAEDIQILNDITEQGVEVIEDLPDVGAVSSEDEVTTETSSVHSDMTVKLWSSGYNADL